MIFKQLKINEIPSLNTLNNIGVLNWELDFFDSNRQPSYLFGCLDQDKFIGCEGYISYKLIRNGELILTHQSERTFIDPNYRGKGIFENLIKSCDKLALKDNSLFCWGATSALRPFSRAGFDTHIGFKSYSFFPIKANLLKKIFSLNKIKLLNPFAIYKLYKNRNLKGLKSVLSLISLFKPIKYSSKIDVKLVDFNYEEVFQLISNQKDSNFMINPSNDLFNWLEKRDVIYKKYNIVNGDNLIGYIVFKMNKEQNFCSVVDVFFKSTQVTLFDILNISAKNTSFAAYDAIFLSLNNSNITHTKWINDLNSHWVINLKKAGSFVIKPFHEKISISDLLLTDLWLEL
jgi:hypothetical protein